MNSAERAGRVLLCLAEDEPTLGVSEVARRTVLAKSVVHRLLDGLTASGLVLRDAHSARYRLSPRALELGLRAIGAADIRALALPLMFDLRERTDETITLSLLIGHERAHIAKLESEQEVRMSVELGKRLPLYAGAAGHAILSQLDDAQLEAYLTETDLAPFTPATIIDPQQLCRSIDRARLLGYAFTAGERNPWAASIAAPIHTSGTVIGALAICGPQARFTPADITRLADAVFTTSAELTAKMS